MAACTDAKRFCPPRLADVLLLVRLLPRNVLCRTLARSYHEDAQLDKPDQEKLRILETYLASSQAGNPEVKEVSEVSMPTRAEDVDRFMAELAAAAGGDLGLAPSAESSDEGPSRAIV